MNLEELGRRAVACKHWRWMRGMLASNGEEDVRIFYVSANHLHLIELEDDEFGMVRIPKDTCLIPDLSDPATLGCLLALVREAWPAGEATTNVHANYSPERGHYRQWSCYYCTGGDWRQALADTEAEALVAALEAAP
ncbi:MAG: hypothetical protein EBR30_27830 [Cytophagia bacterium]|jgi:hypothetical protein|nr:hypothetical protein [Cytophagia bacterium]